MNKDYKRVWNSLNIGISILTPPPPRTADQWADQCRILPMGSAEPGKWRSSKTPYMIPIMRACSNPLYSFVIVCMASQMGKTEALFNVIGHRFDDDPTPTLIILPNQKLAESVSNDRVSKMLSSVPSLKAKLAIGKKNKMSEKFIGGVRLGFGWAGSATELSSHPAGLALIDERDRMEDDAGGEGDPVELVAARGSTYPDSKVIVTSTPTIEDNSPIWKLYEEGTQQQWSWPCPDCGEYFIPRLELLIWQEKSTPHQALKTARLKCPHCEYLIEDHQKTAMNRKGVYVGPEQHITPEGEILGDAIDTTRASFWVSGICSPWKSFGQRAESFVRAKNSGAPGRVQTCINTAFGELYKTAGEAPEWEAVANLRGAYKSDDVIRDVQIITAGVDVQKDRLIYVVRGWGFNHESWLIRFGELHGETEHDAVWSQLQQILSVQWGGKRIKKMLVDSGYKPGKRGDPSQVYNFCRRNSGVAAPAKGRERLNKPFTSSKLDLSTKGATAKRSIMLWHIDSDVHKSWVHGRIDWPPGESGAWHIPSDTTDDYCQQIVAEQRLEKATGLATWIKTKKDNHFLDCEALALAAADIIQVRNLKPLDAKVESRGRKVTKSSFLER